jgi:serine/threonine-protein kinase
MINRIGRYEIQAELGRGGFGHVFRAFDPAMDSLVAIKTLIGDTDPDLLIRFRNEAAAARKLQHKNIITVYDFGEEDRTPYIVMELLDGEDLERTIRSGRTLTLLQKMLIMSEVADGLHYAHSRGVVHRDVKPANVMLLSNGGVKIMDFGIALVTRATGQRLTPQGTIMGTFRYMAPEQFEGLPSDVLCDIFAFGVIYCELLTGRHPFEAPEPAGVMRKIIRGEPPPIRDFCPDCPGRLEQIVHRLLNKDRDLRYRSLEEVQFDVEPILLDLQKAHTVELLERARDLVSRDQGDAAQPLVKEILRLDPGNTGARELRELLQYQQQAKLTHARVEVLLKTGQGKMQQQDFPGAIECFESALRLDRSNAEVLNLIQQARAAMESLQRARTLLDDARRALNVRDLTGAFHKASEAQRLDPRNNDAAVLLELIRRETEAHEREKRLQDGLSRAKSALMLQNFHDAISLLQNLQKEYPESSEATELLNKARLEKSIQARRQRLDAGMEHAKDLLRHQRLADAVQVLEQLDHEFHQLAAVRDLLSYAREELAKHRREEAVARASEEVRGLLEARQFDRAIHILRSALQSFPGEEALSALLQNAISTRADAERRQALADAQQLSQALVAQQRYQEALACMDAFAARHGADTTLAEFRKRAQSEWELQQRIDAMGRILGEARGLIDQGRPGSATELLHEATARFPGDPQIAELLQLAETKLLEHKRAEAVQRTLTEAAELTKTLQFDRALQVVQDGLKKYPDNPELKRCLEATRLARTNHLRQTEKREAIERTWQMHQAGRFGEALAEIRNALRVAPGDADLATLHKQIEADWEARKRLDAIRQVLGQARALLEQARPGEAVSLLEERLSSDPSNTELRSLLDRTRVELLAKQRAEAVQQCAAITEDLVKTLQFNRALAIVEQTLQVHPGDEILVRLRDQTLAARAAHQREVARLETMARADAMARERRFADALDAIDSVLRDQPGDPDLLALREKVQSDRESHERQKGIAQALGEARGLMSQGLIDRATPLLEAALRRYPGEASLSSLLASARETLVTRRRDEEVRQRITEAESLAAALQFDRALKVVEKASKVYPDEPRLLHAGEAILAARTAHNNEKTRQEILDRVGKLHQRSRFSDALRVIDSALPQFPNDPELLALKTRLESEWEAARRNAAVEQVLNQAQGLLNQGRQQPAITLLEESLRQYPNHSGLSLLLARARQELEAQLQAEQLRLRELALQQVPEPPLPAPPVPAVEAEVIPRQTIHWRLIVAAIAVLAVLAGGIVVVSRYLHQPSVSLQVRTNPAGATIQINERSCNTPPCRFDLPPGTYRIEARMSGFRPAATSVTLDARHPAEPVTMALEPVPVVVVEPPTQAKRPSGKPMGTLVVKTEPGADVFVDGSRAGRTNSVGVLKVPISAQEHSVRVEKTGFRTPSQQSLTIADGSTTNIVYPLTPQVTPTVPSPPPAPSKPIEVTKAPDPAEKEWEQVRNSREISAIENYKDKYPASPHNAEAQARIEGLIWEGVDKDSVKALQDFLHKYPKGVHRGEAQARIDELNSEAVNRVARERDQAQLAKVEELNRNRQAIIKTLARFSTALEAQNVDEMKAVFPNMTDKQLKEYKQTEKDITIEASLQMQSDPEISGDAATVICKRQVVTSYKGKPMRPNVDYVQVNLGRKGDGWVILSVIPQKKS